jgi:hypothetical protein
LPHQAMINGVSTRKKHPTIIENAFSSKRRKRESTHWSHRFLISEGLNTKVMIECFLRILPSLAPSRLELADKLVNLADELMEAF